MSKPDRTYSQSELNNRSRQLDPEHDAYWQSRGEKERPDDWQERLERESQSGRSSEQ